MITEKAMKKQALILVKPSGTIAIGGELSAVQRKFYDGFLYIVQESLKKNPNQLWFYVSLKDLKQLLNTEERDKNNKYYKMQIKELQEIEVTYNFFGKDKIINGYTYLIPELEIITNVETGEIEIKFDVPNMVREAFLNKNKESLFAKINVIIKKNLKGRYSLLLYDLLRDYENVEIPKMSIEEFRELFGVKNKYKLFADLRKKVILPAVKEINENPDIEWELEVELEKRGNTYTHIKFIKKRKSQFKQLQQKQEQIKENAKVNVLLGLIPEEYRKPSLKKFLSEFIEEYPIEYIETQIKLVNSRNPKDYIAYLKTAIKEDYAGFYELEEKKEEYKEILEKYFKRAEKIIEVKKINREPKEIVIDLIRIDFNRERITGEEREQLLGLLYSTI